MGIFYSSALHDPMVLRLVNLSMNSLGIKTERGEQRIEEAKNLGVIYPNSSFHDL